MLLEVQIETWSMVGVRGGKPTVRWRLGLGDRVPVRSCFDCEACRIKTMAFSFTTLVVLLMVQKSGKLTS